MKQACPLGQVSRWLPRHSGVPDCESSFLFPGSAVMREFLPGHRIPLKCFLNVWPGYQSLRLEFHSSPFIGFLLCMVLGMTAWLGTVGGNLCRSSQHLGT